jgi:prophage tail gpP-like protein
MLSVLVNGQKYENFVSYEITRSVEDLAGTFSIEMTNGWEKEPPVKMRSKIQIFVDDTSILMGFVEKLNVRYDNGQHIIRFSGRDKVCDLIDSTLGSNIEIKAPTTLDAIIHRVIKEINMTGVKIINQAGKLEKFSAGDIVSGNVDEPIFQFLQKYVRKRQVLMTTDGLGNVVLARTGSKQAGCALLHKVDDSPLQPNNILDAEMEWDDTQRFHLYRIHSQGNPSGAGSTTKLSNKEMVSRQGSTIDPEIRSTRVLDLMAESSTDSATLFDRAEWEAIVRLARGFSYQCTVQGHTMGDGGKPWEPNLLTTVYDDFHLIQDTLLIKAVRYSYNSNGTLTNLELVDPDSYTPEPIKEHQRKKRKIGRKRKGRTDKLVRAVHNFIEDTSD